MKSTGCLTILVGACGSHSVGHFFRRHRSFRSQVKWPAMPAVDVVESEKAYEITAELPGMDEKNIEVKVADGVLTIKGEKREETEEKEKGLLPAGT